MLEVNSGCWAMAFNHTTEKDIEQSCYSVLYGLQPVFEVKNMMSH